MRSMDDQNIIDILEQIPPLLEETDTNIRENQWDDVAQLLARITVLQEQVKAASPDVDTRLEKNPQFKARYEPLKSILSQKISEIIAAVEKWKLSHTEKISDSKNVLDNIAKYYKPSSTSFYIDRKE